MNLVEHAKKELAILNKNGVGNEMQRLADKNILEIIEKFSEQRHSGFSANYVIGLLVRLLNLKPLTSLTGEDDEWEMIDSAYGTAQNKRCPDVFKDLTTGKSYWVEGKALSDDGGKTWHIRREDRVDIEFPFDVPD